MKLFALLLTIFSIDAFSYTELRDWTACEGSKCKEVKAGDDLYLKHNFKSERAIYTTTFTKTQIKACLKQNDCWLYLGSVGDSLTVMINGEVIGNFPDYVHFESLKFQIPKALVKDNNSLSISVIDLNQTRFGLRSREVGIGLHSEVSKLSIIDWLLRTGSPLLSAFTLFVLLLGLIATYIIYQNNKIIPLIALSSLGMLYLISFSEIPRQNLDPIYMSGPVHFILRLSLDLTIIFVSLSFYKPHQKLNFVTKLPYLYALPIITMLIAGVLGIHEYNFYKMTMLIIAPLVIGGALSLAVLSYYYFDTNERRLTLPFFIGLLGLQVYDLFVFWELMNGTFTVKWYLPFLVITFVWLYVRRRILEIRTLKIDAIVGDEIRKLSHDLMAPVKNLNSLLRSSGDSYEKELIKRNILDIEHITCQVLNKYRPEKTEISHINENNLNHILNDLSEKFEKYIKINFSLSTEFDWYNVDATMFNRIFTNLVKNSIEAKATTVEVYGCFKNKTLLLDVKDNGKGISKKIQPYIFENGVSSKNNTGNGLGLSYVKEKLNGLNCCISLLESNLNGTIFRITLPLEEIVLIDDNAIIRDTWRVLAKKAGIQLRAYAKSIDFKPSTVLKTTPIFVDYELDNENGLEVVHRIKSLGFVNVSLATGESRKIHVDVQQVGKEFPYAHKIFDNYGRS